MINKVLDYLRLIASLISLAMQDTAHYGPKATLIMV